MTILRVFDFCKEEREITKYTFPTSTVCSIEHVVTRASAIGNPCSGDSRK
jgi:hypothetical protein